MLKGLNEAIVKYNPTHNDSAIVSVIDDIQGTFHCCGANGPFDWQNNTLYHDGISLPPTCCNKEAKAEGLNCTTTTSFHFTNGCVDIITDELKSSLNTLGWAGVVVIVVQFLGVVFSCMLSNQRREYIYV